MKKICLICFNPFFKRPREGIRFDIRKFCSQPCYHSYARKNLNKGTFKKGNHPKTEFKKGHPKPKNAYIFPFGETHPNWKGNQARYGALHERLKTRFGPAKKCEVCGGKKAPKYNWANLKGKYEDINDYKQMCAKCHKNYDLNHRKLTPNKYSPMSESRKRKR